MSYKDYNDILDMFSSPKEGDEITMNDYLLAINPSIALKILFVLLTLIEENKIDLHEYYLEMIENRTSASLEEQKKELEKIIMLVIDFFAFERLSKEYDEF